MGDCAFGGWEVPALSCSFKVYGTLAATRSSFSMHRAGPPTIKAEW